MLMRVVRSVPSFRRISPLVAIRPFSVDSMRDLMNNENPLEVPEEIAVFKGDDDLFEPCCSFVPGSNMMLVPPNFSKEYASEVAKVTDQLCKMRHGAVRLRVSFEGEKRLDWFPTAFALSPKVLFTDYHCVPPHASLFKKDGTRARLNIASIHGRADDNPTAATYKSQDTLPLELVTRVNNTSQYYPIYDPISGQEWIRGWTRGKGNTDLAVLKISDHCDLSFKTFFYPSAHTENLKKVAYFGYPQPVSPNQFDRVMEVLNEKNYQFPEYADVPPDQQLRAIREAVSSALSDAFCGFNSKILSPGSVMKNGQYIMAVTNSATTGTSGSPYIELNDPSFVVDLGGGIQVSSKHRPNYNLLMTVDHPEWVVKYVKYVLPSLPEHHWPQVRSYIQKHHRLLEELDCVTPEVRKVLA